MRLQIITNYYNRRKLRDPVVIIAARVIEKVSKAIIKRVELRGPRSNCARRVETRSRRRSRTRAAPLDDRWSIKAEYLYVDFGSEKISVPITNTATFWQTMEVDADLTANIARAGLNYRF